MNDSLRQAKYQLLYVSCGHHAIIYGEIDANRVTNLAEDAAPQRRAEISGASHNMNTSTDALMRCSVTYATSVRTNIKLQQLRHEVVIRFRSYFLRICTQTLAKITQRDNNLL